MNPQQGQGSWFKLYRSLFTSEAWNCSLIDRLVWIWILGHARFNEDPQITRDGVTVGRGEVYASNSFIAQGIAWNEGNGLHVPGKGSIHRSLKSLQAAGQIELIQTPKGAKWTHIRVVNWERYQSNDIEIAERSRNDRGTDKAAFAERTRSHAKPLNTNSLQEEVEDIAELPRNETRSRLAPIAERSRNEYKNVRNKNKEEDNKHTSARACARGLPLDTAEESDAGGDLPPKKTKAKASPRSVHNEAVQAFASGDIELPEKFKTDQFKESFVEFLDKREMTKKWVTKRAIDRLVLRLAPYSHDEAVELVTRSTDRCWADVVYESTPPPGRVLIKTGANGQSVPVGKQPHHKQRTTHEKLNPNFAKRYEMPIIYE